MSRSPSIADQPQHAVERSSLRTWTILASACVAVALAAADLTAVATLLPRMIVDLDVPLPDGLSDAAWVVSAYLLGNIVTLPISGRLSDWFSRRAVFVACLAIFAIGSLGSALASSLATLIAARTVQALGAGAMVPVAMALATDVLPRARWPLAFGIVGAVDTAGWAIGPPVGALFVRWLDWRALFSINIPLAIVIALVIWRGLRDVRGETTARPVDWIGMALLSSALIALNLGLSQLGEGSSSGTSFVRQRLPLWAALPWFLGGVGLLIAFGWQQRRAPVPLIGWTWIARRPVVIAAITNLLFGVLLIVATVNVPLFVNAVAPATSNDADVIVRDAAVQSGVVLAAMTLLMTLCAPIGGWLTARLRALPIAFVGALIAAGGLWLMRGWSPTTTQPTMLLHLAPLGVGFGLVIAPAAAVIVDAAPADERGVAASFVLLLRLSGMSLGLSALTAWSLLRFRALAAPYSILELPSVIAPLTAEVLAGSFGLAAGLALVVVVVNLLGGTSDHVER